MKNYLLASVLDIWMVVEKLQGFKVPNQDLVQAQDVHMQDPLPE